jgi:orotidine-5'-phosphate decarboxylase
MTSFNERIARSSKEKNSRIVLALDTFDEFENRLRHAERVLRLTKGGIAAVKLNHHLLLPFGLAGVRGVIKTCHDEGLPLIADLKLNDIESTNVSAVKSLIEYGFDAFIANPFVGYKEGLGGAIHAAHSRGCGVLLLVYMSHRGAAEGYSLRVDGGKPLYQLFAERAKRWRADGVVVSAKSNEKIKEARRIVGEKCMIFAPGVGAQGGKAAGASSGADFLIVGRTIMESSDPARVVRELNAA